MRYAHLGNTRIEAWPKGRAACQICGGELYAACGEIQIWHWRHEVFECDSWYESMSDWHINWQNKFPEKWREKVILKDGTKHIADIQTINGKVIEFQHSPISSAEIKKREAFYQDMLWVIDARSFKGNFKIRSSVTTHLSAIRRNKSEERSQVMEDLKEEIEAFKKRILNLKREIEQIPNDISTAESKLKRYNEINLDIKAFVQDNLMESWLDKRYYFDYKTNDLTHVIERYYRPQIILILNEKKDLQEEIRTIQEKLNRYNELQIIKIRNNEFKIADYYLLRPEDFKKIKAIRKESLLTPYHDIKQIQSESEFRNFESEKDKFHFALDLSDSISKFSDDIREIVRYIEIAEEKIIKIENLIISDVSISLEELIKTEKSTIEELAEHLLFQKKSLIDFNLSLIEKEKKIDSNHKEIIQGIDKSYHQAEVEIMKKYKGKYSFIWKHERKSWRSANTPILFDVGEDYLFLIEGENKLRKVPIKMFLTRLINSDKK